MKRIALFLLLSIFVAAMHSCKGKRKPKNYNAETIAGALVFMKAASESNATEIAVANVVLKKSKNPRVIGFANMMITDHSNAGKELMPIMAQKKVNVKDSISSEHQAFINSLSAKQGADLDKTYMQMMVADHEKAIQLFTNASNDKDREIKSFADKILPALKMHLDSAKAINASLK